MQLRARVETTTKSNKAVETAVVVVADKTRAKVLRRVTRGDLAKLTATSTSKETRK